MPDFNTRQEFIDAASSEKIVLAHINAKQRLINFSLLSGAIYFKTTSYFIDAVAVVGAGTLTRVATLGAVTQGTFYYDINTSRLYINLSDDSDPALSEVIVTNKLFFSNNPVSMPHDLQDTSADVYYDGRISRAPNFSSKIGIEQGLVSTVGSGTIELENGDGGLDEVYDTLVFENQEVAVYSFNRDLPATEAKLIFRGIIHDKGFSSSKVNFGVKDNLFNLLENIPQGIYTEADNVNQNVRGSKKRWLYGRVDGLKLQSIDQIGDGYTLTGTGSIIGDSATLTGVGTAFLSEVSPGDALTIGTLEFSVDQVQSDTVIVLDDEADYSISGAQMTLKPARAVTTKNRTLFVADHACAKVVKSITSALQFNRVVLNSTLGLFAGDVVEFQSGERIEIKNIAPGNIIVLQQNLITLPAIGSTVTRQPIQDVYVEGARLLPADYTINNTASSTTVTIDADAEINIAPIKNLNQSLTFTNGSRFITGGTELESILEARDLIRPEGILYTTFYEILEVTDTQITLRTPFADPTTTDTAEFKAPKYIGDNTVVSCDALGKTVDGTPTGEWIATGSDLIKDLLTEIGLGGRINAATFAAMKQKQNELISIAFPLNPGGSSITVKDAIDKINISTNMSLSLDNDLDLQLESTLVQAPSAAVTIDDSDVVSWRVISKSGKLYEFSDVKYRHTDVDRFTLESGAQAVRKTNKFISNYVGSGKTLERDIYLYNSTAAEIYTERSLYYNSLARSQIEIDTDLRLEGLEIGDVVVLNFKRLYKRFGDAATRKKLASVVGKTVTGEGIKLELSDFGNTFSTSAFITDNGAPDFSGSSSEEKLINGFITDPEGIVDNIEETNKTNLIS